MPSPKFLVQALVGGGSPAQSRTPHVHPPTGGVPGLRKIDIQSWVLIRQFSNIFDQFWTPKRPGNCNPSDEKACRLAHFEAPELSYPKMTFLDHFWNLQNRSKSAPGAPKTSIYVLDRRKTARISTLRASRASNRSIRSLEALQSETKNCGAKRRDFFPQIPASIGPLSTVSCA